MNEFLVFVPFNILKSIFTLPTIVLLTIYEFSTRFNNLSTSNNYKNPFNKFRLVSFLSLSSHFSITLFTLIS